ncbi:hypothetical protein AVEN_127977-1 [Araneus ventricosus]|uniref:DUF4817 domain-containing protein n=1 Tax=Araneus ventricosus TaxID=182803 RepID=A0A4Y1ZZC0_ARAVE|nr:hypothetical protein AVEN_127977-1 [Araneus ventricosus]
MQRLGHVCDSHGMGKFQMKSHSVTIYGPQHSHLVSTYHLEYHIPTATRCSFQKRFNVPKGLNAKTIRKLFARFEWTGSVNDNRVRNVGPRQTVVTPENVAKVSGIVQQNPRNTVRRITSETSLKCSSMQKILRNSLRMFPYKIQSHQAIPIKAVRQRFDFANEILAMIDNKGFDVGCIWFTDEAHFHLRLIPHVTHTTSVKKINLKITKRGLILQ